MSEIRSLCVYCGASNQMPDSHRAAARRLGEMMGAKRLILVFGGGGVGMMGEVAAAALRTGGTVIGVIPEHLKRREIPLDSVTELIVTVDMHERKARMAEKSDAFLILPGGLGTLEEMFEMLTWRQLGIHDKPLVLVNTDGYWDQLLGLIDHMRDLKYAGETIGPLMAVVDTPEAALELLGA